MSVVPLGGLFGVLSQEDQARAETEGARLEPTVATPSRKEAASDPSLLRFAAAEDFPALAGDAERAALLPVLVPPLRASDRGKLGLVLEEAIEGALERRGACPPGIGATSDLDAALGDQLYRARLVELRGLFVWVGAFEGAAGLNGALDADDSAVLRFWLEAARSRPIRLVLDECNRGIGVYGPPVALASLVLPEQETHANTEPMPQVSPEITASSRAMDPPGSPVSLAGDLARALMEELTQPDSRPPPAAAEPAESVTADEPRPDWADTTEPASSEVSSGGAETPVSQVRVSPAAEAGGVSPAAEIDAAHALPSEVQRAPAPPLDPAAGDNWPTWLAELERARGPKPLGAVERMFVQNYVPLRDAYLRGLAPAEVGSVLEGWAVSFAKSYADAFDALRARGKRPTMVLDVPDAALRIGRLHGARSVQLLLVDGMRFDLGLRLERQLRTRLGGEAALTERLLMWSALPSNSNTQLELIGRGSDGLRDLGQGPPSDVPVTRGRMAKTPRRIKVGHREILKLDLVEARLSEAGPAEAERLDLLAEELTESVAEFAEKLPARTLLVVFGDHGCVLDPQGKGGTGAARQGGARPEEVLVPAYFWLIGGVQ